MQLLKVNYIYLDTIIVIVELIENSRNIIEAWININPFILLQSLNQIYCPFLFIFPTIVFLPPLREVHDKIPKKRKKLKPNEMKLILNWKLAGEAQVGLDRISLNYP